ncbi:CHLH [Symbiodinium natans]|uniref:CHLH protein n=1 Tax=Symbiodinium natans TaxID=878477 RepID=A0A812UXM5_9DINO|nr:CHLH [Symbiodinium natans]
MARSEIFLSKLQVFCKLHLSQVGVVQELEHQPARVACTFTGGLDFSVPVQEYLSGPTAEGMVDALVNLTGFSLVGGPTSQDAKKAKEVLMKLNRPYLVSVPLVFQSFTEWQNSQLGLHPVHALQVSLPEIDGAIEPLIFSGRDGTSGRSIPMQARYSGLWCRWRRDFTVCCLFFPLYLVHCRSPEAAMSIHVGLERRLPHERGRVRGLDIPVCQ